MKVRPIHQQERGPRHGNNRLWIAKQKIQDRRADRRKFKEEFNKIIKDI